MPPQLVALSEGPNILLDKPIVLVGRHPECDIQIPSRKVSRRHCCIAQVLDHLVVRDLCSTNGIRVNGVRVVEGFLKAGDELTIGSYRYQLRWPAQASAPVVGTPSSEARPPSLPADFLESCDLPVAIPDDFGGMPTPKSPKEWQEKKVEPADIPNIAPPPPGMIDFNLSDEFRAPSPPSS